MSYWKVAGLSYLQYVTLATTALRQAVKPTNALKYTVREEVQYKQQLWKDGKATTERVMVKIDPASAGKTNVNQKGTDPTGGN